VIIFVPAPAPAPAPVFIPAPAPVFIPAPAPAPVLVLPPVPEEKKSVIETVTVIVVLPPATVIESAPEPAELTTQKQEKIVVAPVIEVAPEKVLTKISVPKMATFKGTGPFKFAIALMDQEDSKVIKDPELAIGLKVFSQTPAVCRVSAIFSKVTGRYSISVTGISNGQCRITAVDRGNDDKFPTATEIKQTITGIATKKTVIVKGVTPAPVQKPGIKKASFKPKKS
jgi:hypothetical protein